MAETMLTEVVERATADRVQANRAKADRAKADRAQADRVKADREKANRTLVDRARADQAKAALLKSRIYTLRTLVVEQEGESIVLRGRVESFYHKQLAQELVRVAVEGTEVVNSISVVYGRDRAPAGAEW